MNQEDKPKADASTVPVIPAVPAAKHVTIRYTTVCSFTETEYENIVAILGREQPYNAPSKIVVAIKYVMSITGLSLRNAKDLVDTIKAIIREERQ